MECDFRDIFTIILVIIIVLCIFNSFAKLGKLQKQLQYTNDYPVPRSSGGVTGGSILETVKAEEVGQILDAHTDIKKIGSFNFKFPEYKDEVMSITATVVSKK
jgi:hypothetical protein